MLIMTAQELADAKRKGIKQQMMGNDFRCQNGARPQVQRNKKADAKRERFGRKQKNDLMRD